MQFISAQCPHCSKELQLPDDAQQVVCMYCAKPIDVQQVLHAQEDTDSYRALLHTAKELMKDDVVAYKANIQAVNNTGIRRRSRRMWKSWRQPCARSVLRRRRVQRNARQKNTACS